MPISRRHILASSAIAPLLQLASADSWAQDWPSQPVKVIVPFAAGGGVDILTRALGLHLAPRLNQAVLVDNRTGAGGNVGVALAAKAPADGYTLLMATTGTHCINPGLYATLPFDPQRDFAPITLIASVPNLLVVNPKLSVGSVAELMQLMKQSPREMSFASFGNGTSNHLSGELFKSKAGIRALHVPYKSATQAVADLIAGQTDFAFVNAPLALPQVKAGKLRALAVTGARRSPSMPEFPTMNESGLPGFIVESWYGLMAPAGTTDAVVDRLSRETIAALQEPELRTLFVNQGADVETSTPAEFAERIKREKEMWAEVIKTTGARLD